MSFGAPMLGAERGGGGGGALGVSGGGGGHCASCLRPFLCGIQYKPLPDVVSADRSKAVPLLQFFFVCILDYVTKPLGQCYYFSSVPRDCGIFWVTSFIFLQEPIYISCENHKNK